MYLGFQATWQRVLHELHNIVHAKVTSVNEVYQNPFGQLEGIQYLSGSQACQRCTESLHAENYQNYQNYQNGAQAGPPSQTSVLNSFDILTNEMH